jgi:hypothetical protein
MPAANSIVVAAVLGLGVVAHQAAVISFGFSGTLTDVDTGAVPLPEGIALGVPFSGVMAYDTAAAFPGSENPPRSDYGAYYFKTAGFSFWVNVGGHFYSTVAPAPDTSWFNIIIWDGRDDLDEFATDNSLDNFRVDNSTFPEAYKPRGGFSLYLSDHTATALSGDALPTSIPAVEAWTTLHRFEVILNTGSDIGYHFLGTITALTSTPPPTLTIRRKAADEVVLAWPVLITGFVLESASGPGTNDWAPVVSPVVDLETQHTVTLPSSSGSRIFRLKPTP